MICIAGLKDCGEKGGKEEGQIDARRAYERAADQNHRMMDFFTGKIRVGKRVPLTYRSGNFYEAEIAYYYPRRAWNKNRSAKKRVIKFHGGK